MKKLMCVLTAMMLMLQLTFAGEALAAGADITVAFYGEDGSKLGDYTYQGNEFNIDHLESYSFAAALTPEEITALKKAAKVELGTSFTNVNDGPAITAGENSEGEPITVTVTGDASRIQVSDGAKITMVGDLDTNNNMETAIQTVGDATVNVEGENIRYNVDIQNAKDASGNEIPNKAEIKLVGDVVGAESGIHAEGKADVEVDGTVWGAGTGISVEENAEVIVTGEMVSGQEEGIHVTGDAEVHITNGDVSAKGYKEYTYTDENGVLQTGHYPTGIGVLTEDHGLAEVNGDVTGQITGIIATDSSKVEVTGAVQGGYPNIIENVNADGTVTKTVTGVGNGVRAEDSATVHVTENVRAYNTAVVAEESAKVTAEGNVTSYYGSGIQAENQKTPEGEVISENHSEVKVEGNVSAYVNGIMAEGDSKVQVEGMVQAGHQETHLVTGFDGTEKEKKEYIGTGITASESAKVTAGSVLGSLAAVNAGGNSEVTVHGYAQAKRTGINAFEDSTVVVDGTVRAVRVEEYSYINSNGETVTNTYLAGTGISAADQAKVTAGEVLAGNTAIHTTGHAEVKVQGDAQSLNGVGIYAFNDTEYDTEKGKYVEETTDTKVTVGGDLTSANTSIRADGEAEIQVDGNVTSLKGETIVAEGESTVTVGKNVEGTSANLDFNTAVIEVTEGADVTVDGSVHSSKGDAIWIETQPVPNPETYVAEDPEKNASITVGGDVTADDGAAIHMTGNADVVVMGNVTGGQLTETEDYGDMTAEEAAVNPYYQARKQAQAEAFSDLDVVEEKHGAVEIESTQDASGKLIINGTVSANGDDIPLVIKVSAGEEELPEEPIELGLPEMKIYELAPGTDGSYFDVDVTLGRSFSYSVEDNGATNQFVTYENEHIAISEEEHAALVETIAAAIQYIIKVDPAYQNGAIKVADEFYDAENDLYAAHEGEEVSVTFSLDSSYELSASGNYTLKDNGDGTWTLTVQRGGGVTLTAVIRRQEQQAEPVSAERVHPAVGKSILFGRYDLDGDEKPEELSWQILRVSGGYARLAMIAGFDEIPGDFDSAFNEWETEQIREGSLQPLDAGRTKELFGDGMVHPSMYVRFDALKLD